MKTTSEIRIKSKLNRKTGAMVVTVFVGKLRYAEYVIAEGCSVIPACGTPIGMPILLENGFGIRNLPEFQNASDYTKTKFAVRK